MADRPPPGEPYHEILSLAPMLFVFAAVASTQSAVAGTDVCGSVFPPLPTNPKGRSMLRRWWLSHKRSTYNGIQLGRQRGSIQSGDVYRRNRKQGHAVNSYSVFDVPINSLEKNLSAFSWFVL